MRKMSLDELKALKARKAAVETRARVAIKKPWDVDQTGKTTIEADKHINDVAELVPTDMA